MTDILSIVAGHGSTLFWAVFKSILLWGGLGLVLALVLYFAVTRLGGVDIQGEKRRWARVVFGLVLFLLFLPLFSLGGGITGARDATIEVLADEAKKNGLSPLIGRGLCVPIVLAHIVAEDELKNPDFEKYINQIFDDADVSFMLDAKLKSHAFSRLSVEFIRYGLEQSEVTKKLKENEVGGWLLLKAQSQVLEKVDKKMEFYLSLFESLEAGPDGKLTYAEMSEQVGDTFLRKRIFLYLEDLFNGIRLNLLIIAFLAVGLVIGIIRLYSWKWGARA